MGSARKRFDLRSGQRLLRKQAPPSFKESSSQGLELFRTQSQTHLGLQSPGPQSLMFREGHETLVLTALGPLESSGTKALGCKETEGGRGERKEKKGGGPQRLPKVPSPHSAPAVCWRIYSWMLSRGLLNAAGNCWT